MADRETYPASDIPIQLVLVEFQYVTNKNYKHLAAESLITRGAVKWQLPVLENPFSF
jgi:hypothetical protein